MPSDWLELQTKIFLRWVNQRLAVRSMTVEGLDGFKSGEQLVALLEILTETKCPYKIKAAPKMKMQQIDNCSNALKFVVDCGINMTIKTSPENLLEGEAKAVLGLIWGIMQNFLKFQDDEDGPTLSVKDSLIMWFENQTIDHPELEIKDVTKSFHNGLIIAATIAKHRPKLINVSSLDPEAGPANLQQAFDAATEFFGLEQYLTPADVLKLDEKSMIVFLSEFFYGIAAQRKIDLAARRIGKVIAFTKENDVMRSTYKERSGHLKELLDRLSEKMGDRTIDNCMGGAKARLDGFYNYKTTEKGETVDSDYLSLETCANLLAMRLAQHERPHFSPEMTLESFLGLLKELEVAEAAMKVHLHTELNRQLKLEGLNTQHEKRSTTVFAFGKEKKEYLAIKQDIQSVGAAEFQLKQLAGLAEDCDHVETALLADAVTRGDELRKESFEHSDDVTKRETDMTAMLEELSKLREDKELVAKDDLEREKFKEKVLGKNTRHGLSHANTMSWCNEKTEFLSKKEEINSIADAELQLSLLHAYMNERNDLEAVRVPELQALGKDILAQEYKSDYSSWKLPADQVEALNARETEVVEAWPKLDVIAKEKEAVLDDDLAREKFREQLRQDNVAHIAMFDDLMTWINAQKVYLGNKEACGSVADATSNLSQLASYERQKGNKTTGSVPAMKKVGKSIIDRKYETSLSSYVFPTPEEITTREQTVDDDWVALDALCATKKAILEDDLARELFKEKLRQDNEQHKSKHAKLVTWVDAKKAYLSARDEVLSVTQAQENVSNMEAYSAEKLDVTNGDVDSFKQLGAKICAAKYETELSSYVFETPDEISTRETYVDNSWLELEELYTKKIALANDDLAREVFKEKLRQQGEQHRKKWEGLTEWANQKQAYLETKEEVNSVTDAQQNLATHTSYEEEKTITVNGGIAGLKKLGNDIITDKYESELSSYMFEKPEEITGRESEIEKFVVKLDGISAEKKLVLEDDLAREEFKEKLRGMNTTHINDFNNLKAWVATKTAYLEKKDEVDSISDAQQNLAALLAYTVEKDYTTSGDVASMKKMGQDILAAKYETSLSNWKWETPEELSQREGEIDEDWSKLDELHKTKQAILDDDLKREEFRERLRLDAENHKNNFNWLCEFSDTSVKYLETKEPVDSLADANANLTTLDAFQANKANVCSFNVGSLKKLGERIKTSKYETELSSYVFAHPEEIDEREEDIDGKWLILNSLASQKWNVLEEDLERENKKEELRLQFARSAAEYEAWVKDRKDDAANMHFGFVLKEVEDFNDTLKETDGEWTSTGSEKLENAQGIYSEAKDLGVTENQYTTSTPHSLEQAMTDVKDCISELWNRYNAELKRMKDNDQLCIQFNDKVTPFANNLQGTKDALTSAAGTDLTAQLELINSKLEEDDSSLKELEELQKVMDDAGIMFNPHTPLTSMDAGLLWKSCQAFLNAKKKNVEEEIHIKKMRGLTQEQYDELEKMFKQFDKSGNGFLDRNEFKACLYSLGEDRGAKEVKEIMKKYSSTEEGIDQAGFLEFMIAQLGDTDTKDEIMYAFALINGDFSPNQKKRDQLSDEEKEQMDEQMAALTKVCMEPKMIKVMQDEEVSYLLSTHAKDGGAEYDRWTEEVFAR